MEGDKIILKSSHIHLNNSLVENIFKNIHYAFVVYEKEQKQLLITPVSSQWFTKIHQQPAQFLLKSINIKGDQSLAIREILIDHNLDMTNRKLDYEIIKKTNLIKIKM